MSFLSFLSSHRLHSSHRPWIEPLGMRFDLILHEHPSKEDAPPPAVPGAQIELPAGAGAAVASLTAPEPPCDL